MSELVGDLQADRKYYQTNIALAASSLAAKTTALAAQLATAAASELTALFALAWRFEPTMVMVLLVLMLILLATRLEAIDWVCWAWSWRTPRPSSQTRG
jgi:hypothetical protein